MYLVNGALYVRQEFKKCIENIRVVGALRPADYIVYILLFNGGESAISRALDGCTYPG
jgi:hypothetical protein